VRVLFLGVTKKQFKVTLKIPVTQAHTCTPFILSLLPGVVLVTWEILQLTTSHTDLNQATQMENY